MIVEQRNQPKFLDAPFHFHRIPGDQLVLMTKDAQTLYAYWNISDSRIQMAEHFAGCSWIQIEKLLRVYEVTQIPFTDESAGKYEEIPIPGDASQWFAGGLLPGASYCIDYGMRSQHGGFLSLLRSSVINLPRNTLAAERLDGGCGLDERKHSLEGLLNVVPEPEWKSQFTGYSLHSN